MHVIQMNIMCSFWKVLHVLNGLLLIWIPT